MKHKQKQFIIYLCQSWLMPVFLILVLLGKIGSFLVWYADNGIDQLNYRFFIPIMECIDKKIRDDNV